MSAEIEADRRGGFVSNPRIRKVIEKRAMVVVLEAYSALLLKDLNSTIYSICTTCFATVATVKDEHELSLAESTHRCSSSNAHPLVDAEDKSRPPSLRCSSRS